ncbi:MAG: YdeI/OmpD-associated family protein [Anaerolineales bacterium]
MTQKHHFRTVIEDAGGGGAYVTIPFDVERIFGKKRPKVRATIDGETYRGTLVRMGSPYYMLIVLKEIRQKIGKSFGDEVSIELEQDHEPRQVELPADLQQALQAIPAAQAVFDRLSYTHQREYVRWITEAKREQTRLRRIQQTIEMLIRGKRGH